MAVRVLLLLGILVVSIQLTLVKGVCVHEGLSYLNSSAWQSDPCNFCTCVNDIVVCYRVQCKAVSCQFNKGESLQILPNECCPQCESNKGSCEYNSDTIIGHNTESNPSKCEKCFCFNGILDCQNESCPQLRCTAGQANHHTQEDCCPKCISVGRPCNYGGTSYTDGSEWSPVSCTRCRCKDGSVQCFVADCPPLICNQHEQVVVKPEKCCPECVGPSCSDGGQTYEDGSQWKRDPCTHCKCKGGDIECTVEHCQDGIACKSGQQWITRSDSCCAECLSTQASCDFGGKTWYNGDMWNSSGCEYCMCNDGIVTCLTAECQKIMCKEGEVVVKRDGNCCPQCTVPSGYCIYQGRTYRNDDDWEPDVCLSCHCNAGDVSCFRRSCPPCPQGMVAQQFKGECCPDCTPVTCSNDCIGCDIRGCLQCKDGSKLLQDGRCVDRCQPGYFQSEHKLCHACHPSCAECSDGTEYHCITCADGHVLKYGQCVVECGPGYFKRGSSCFECHASCLDCTGEMKSQCLTCANTTNVIRRRKCVEECGAGFYIKDGICLECDDSCMECEYDSPRCTTCPSQQVIQDGVCVPVCGVGFYQLNPSYCEACHPSCYECNGPGKIDCTSCTLSNVLLNGMCLSGCSDGHYVNNGRCFSCHQSCRTCIDGREDGCTSCLDSNYVVQGRPPYTGDLHGRCLSECQQGQFSNEHGICLVCHATCKTCMDTSIEGCISCASPLVLSDGNCIRQCESHRYQSNRVCYDCHSSCDGCSGPSSSECTSCNHLATLQNGECLTRCAESVYPTSQGHCKPCHPSCAACVTSADNTGSICTQCQDSTYFILDDICVDDCGRGYFVHGGICRECHSSCVTCIQSGSSGCTSCNHGDVLSHRGTCLRSCYDGYYSDNGICRECSSNCLVCSGPFDCIICRDPLYVVQFGECVSQCAQQFYADPLTRECKECDWSCNSCVGPTSFDCIHCMDGVLLQNGSCVADCTPGHYQLDQQCRACDSKCLSCNGPMSCTECFSPLLLLGTQCVEDCGPAMYKNHASHQCISCPDFCIECSSSIRCVTCMAGSFLRNWVCLTHCGDGFYENTETSSCEVNIYPPDLYVNGTLTSPIGGSVLLDSSFLSAYDTDTAYLDLFFYVDSQPTNGDLIKNVLGEDKKMQRGDTFTFEELIQGNIRYKHDKSLPLTGTMSLRVNDRQYDSPPRNVDIVAISNSPPSVQYNQPLVVSESSMAEITQRNIRIQDQDNPESVILTVLEGPNHGSLIRFPGRTQVTSFDLNDLQRGLLRYVHDGSETQHDVLVIQVSDGNNVINFMFEIHIQPQDNKGPILVNNVQARVEDGGSTQITSNLLSATDVDSTDDDLVYQLTPPENNPKHGDLMMVLPVPSTGVENGWIDKGNGVMETKAAIFRQKDVNDGHLWYKHQNDEAKSDYFMFEISDGGNPPNVLSDQAFNIAIMPRDDEPPQLAAGVPLPLGATVFEGELIPLGHNHLAFYDPDSPDSDLLYDITTPLRSEQGSIEHIDRPHLPVTQFTQADVNAQKIVYRPPDFDVGQKQVEFTFYFTVSDSSGNVLSPQPFTIRLIPTNTAAPIFANRHPIATVSQGGTTAIGEEHLLVTDLDTRLADLTYTLSRAPYTGEFIKSDRSTRVILRIADSFTHAEVTSNTFYYVHDGSDILQDEFEISVSDGTHIDTATLTMVVLPVDKSSPVLMDDSLLALLVPEVSTATVTRDHLAFIDDESPDDEVILTLLSTPRNGRLQIRVSDKYEDLVSGSAFTQADINNYDVRYQSEGEIGSRPSTDRIFMNVSDSNGNILPNQVLSVTITPVNNQPPVVTVGDGLLVEEGGDVLISSQDLLATDVDTPLTELLVVMDTGPSFGYIENARQEYGSEKTPGGVAQHVFTIQDVIDNVLYYVQDVHTNIEPVWDGFLFHVSDGVNQSPTYRFNISIQLINDEEPMILTEQLYCPEGEGVVVSNVSLYVSDMDTSVEDLLFTVIKTPSHGELRRREFIEDPIITGRALGAGASFTYEDILDELVVYIHDDSDIQRDSFEVSLTDGAHVTSDTINVVIGLVNDETPRMAINRGLQIRLGETTSLTEDILLASDVDSADTQLVYTLTRLPDAGEIQYFEPKSGYIPYTITGPSSSWTQEDINNGRVRYVHRDTDPAGTLLFKFTLSDPEGNRLIDQSFIITILEDHIPPQVLANNGLVLDEGSSKKITTSLLSSTDVDSNPADLLYYISTVPSLGHLEYISQPGLPITQFTQGDLAAKTIRYVHTSTEEDYMDTFTFSVDDGTNQVTQTFYITIVPVDDSLPQLTNFGMTVQEGVRKMITEFELKATDADTKENYVIFTIVQPPLRGQIQYTMNGLHHSTVSTFSMEDVYENRISYIHDGSNTLQDSFVFSVTDGTNPRFMVHDGGNVVTTNEPQLFSISVLPVDDGTPRLVTNLGIQYLEYTDDKALAPITQHQLRTIDMDTEDDQILYTLTTPPQFGFLESTLVPSIPISSFTQEDLNNGIIRYMLYNEVADVTDDSFVFDIADSKPNIVSDNVFRIRWSRISFEYDHYNVSETAGLVQVTVKRTGNLNQYAIVLCRTEQGSATSEGVGSLPGKHDYVEQAGQVQFEEREDTKYCNVIINDDTVFEGTEMFKVELSMPAYALLGKPHQATVTILDEEDQPSIQFEESVFHVNESSGYLFAPMLRKGDTSSAVSAVCFTIPRTASGSSLEGLESGSDFKTRGMTDEYRVVFPPNVNKATCDIKLIDDTMFEEEEEFEISLADPSMMTNLGTLNKAIVKINGPNDESYIFLSQPVYYFGENEKTVEIEVLRQGSDLSHSSMVWCGTRASNPLSALPGDDFIPGSSQITFGPQQTLETCSFTILDDTANPHIEGNETFIVYLSAAMGATVAEPYKATVVINDTDNDLPCMQFAVDEVIVKESDGIVHIPVVRTGDISFQSSVRCYTRQRSAQVMMDFDERRNTDEFRVVFLPGEKVKNCSVLIVEDDVYEEEEQFLVRLGDPLGNDYCDAKVGTPSEAKITITNTEDAPTIQIERMAYTVYEPTRADDVSLVNVVIVRTGDHNGTSKVRCSTRDGSAKSGIDYNPKSRLLKMQPGVKKLDFNVEILFNKDVEWHETFNVVLGPDEPVNALLGSISIATITILDQEAAGSLVLPAPPLVVSLMQYDDVETGCLDNPSPGYPLICVTPCDPHYPSYSMTGDLCTESGINSSTIHYGWEIAAPTDLDGSRPPFVTITDNTLFTSVDHRVLDSIYFSRRSHVRCVAQPVDNDGNLGVPLRSNIVTIATDFGICHTPIVAGISQDFQAQSFIATLEYVDSKDKTHPNTIHVSVQVPHQDGMLPLLSTLPLHNIRFLLTEPIYRQQHICSNIITGAKDKILPENGFLETVNYKNMILGPGYDYPYQFDPSVREDKSLLLYQHLDLKTCTWTFDSWYHMTDLIDLCGGAVTTDFQIKRGDQSYLTVTVPLYAAYIYSTVPTGWASLDHRTEMEFSFFYSTVLWRTGLETEGDLNGKLQVIHIRIDNDGRLVIDFKTEAKFRGLFVLDHHTLPGMQSRIVPPARLGVNFDLDLLWSEQTFDGPHQLWRATSNYNLKDYSGDYAMELIPCTVTSTQSYGVMPGMPVVCTGHMPHRFVVPIAFQQTNRPVPVVYSLNTQFHLMNNEKIFLMNPGNSMIALSEMDYKGSFAKGQTLYGRVLWNPDQDLDTAYKLRIEKMYLCTGSDGYVPTYDPTGALYGEGPQYGCIQPNKYLKHRFLVLDRGAPEAAQKSFNEVPFEAQFATENPNFKRLNDMPGADGFTMKVDALYKIDSGHQWYLQVLYVIGSSDSLPRYHRSALLNTAIKKREIVDVNGNLIDESIVFGTSYNSDGHNGTNMRVLRLNDTTVDSDELSQVVIVSSALIGVVLIIVIAVIVVVIICRRHHYTKTDTIHQPSNRDAAMELDNAKLAKKCEDDLGKDFRKTVSFSNINIQKHDNLHTGHARVKKTNLDIDMRNNLKGEPGTEV